MLRRESLLGLLATAAVAALLLFAAPPARGEGPEDDAARLGKQQKLAAKFLTLAPWHLDRAGALEEGKKSGRLVFAYVTRSFSPCEYCEAFEKGTLEDAAFNEFAKDVVLWCHVTTHVPGDEDFATEYDVHAYPTVLVLDAEGTVVAREQGDRSVRGLRAMRASATGFVAIRQASEAEPDRRDLRLALLLARVERDLLDAEAAREQAAALAPLSPEEARGLESAIAHRELRILRSERRLGALWQRAREVVEAEPLDPEAEAALALVACYGLKEPRRALRHLERALRGPSDDVDLHRAASATYLNLALWPLAVEHDRWLLARDPQDGAALRSLASSARFGMDAWKRGATTKLGEHEVTAWEAVGAARDEAQSQVHRLWVAERAGSAAFWVFDVAYPKGERTELTLGSPDGVGILRTIRPAVDAAAVEALFPQVAPGLADLHEALVTDALGAFPLEAAAVRRALQADPHQEKAKAMLEALTAEGWEASEAGPAFPLGGGEARAHAPSGPKAGASIWRRVGIVSRPDGTTKRVYTLERGSQADEYWLRARDDRGAFVVRRYAGSEPAADVVQRDLSAAEGALDDVLEARWAAWAGEGYDAAGPHFDRARTLLERALRADPADVVCAYDAVSTALAASDRETDPVAAAPWYRLALKAAPVLEGTGAFEADVAAVLGVFYYRFGAYPLVATSLAKAEGSRRFQGRVPEVSALLALAGHDRWQASEPFSARSFRIQEFRRAPADRAAEEHGLLRTEVCFVAEHDGRYAFTVSYRVFRSGDIVERDLALARYEEPIVIRAFPKDVPLEDLRAEVLEALEALGVLK